MKNIIYTDFLIKKAKIHKAEMKKKSSPRYDSCDIIVHFHDKISVKNRFE